jgi:NAD(P)-dependent dehydrogenase (short-subunit alcohol dehydrogenase family)
MALTRSLAIEGRKAGIVANCVMPWAFTRLATSGDPDGWLRANIQPAGAAAVMAWLAHANCGVTGEMFAAAGRHVARVTLAMGTGVVVDDMTPEAVASVVDRAMALEPVNAPRSTRRYVDDIVRPALTDD